MKCRTGDRPLASELDPVVQPQRKNEELNVLEMNTSSALQDVLEEMQKEALFNVVAPVQAQGLSQAPRLAGPLVDTDSDDEEEINWKPLENFVPQAILDFAKSEAERKRNAQNEARRRERERRKKEEEDKARNLSVDKDIHDLLSKVSGEHKEVIVRFLQSLSKSKDRASGDIDSDGASNMHASYSNASIKSSKKRKLADSQ
ncbi:hypothetical protein CVT24_011508 [Panaeolus cyanescens]|uniref:Uncharacterized protein n=1 Tax=Panaeolus cyanescens TaxID=181874 RepID=A0A409VGR5_9AGAR|nr:hypothetical protein CVT24_011508 [Panaeolus cyanescens]